MILMGGGKGSRFFSSRFLGGTVEKFPEAFSLRRLIILYTVLYTVVYIFLVTLLKENNNDKDLFNK